jgi:hypothetical protein
MLQAGAAVGAGLPIDSEAGRGAGIAGAAAALGAAIWTSGAGGIIGYRFGWNSRVGTWP